MDRPKSESENPDCPPLSPCPTHFSMMKKVMTKKERKVKRGSSTMERWYALCARSTKVRTSQKRMAEKAPAKKGATTQEMACRMGIGWGWGQGVSAELVG